MAEEVVFKPNGDWSFSGDLSELDVKQEPGSHKDGRATVDAPSPAAADTGSKSGKRTPKKFDMNKIKKSAGRSKKNVKAADSPDDEKKDTSSPTLKEPKPEPPKEAKLEPAPEPLPDPVPSTEPAPAPAPEPEPEPVVEEPVQPAPTPQDTREAKEFKLAQMGLSGREVTPTEHRESGVAEMHLNVPNKTLNMPDQAPPPKSVFKGKPPVDLSKFSGKDLDEIPKSRQPHPETKATVEDKGPDPDFIFHNLEEFYEVSGLSPDDLSKFVKAVVRAAATRTTIWSSKEHPTLRAYSCTPVSGRGIPAGVKCMLAIGWDIHMTCCYVNNSFAVSDGSTNLTCVGTCAYVRDTPVALSMERKRDAVAL